MGFVVGRDRELLRACALEVEVKDGSRPPVAAILLVRVSVSLLPISGVEALMSGESNGGS
jgi:hypothetical protein